VKHDDADLSRAYYDSRNQSARCFYALYGEHSDRQRLIDMMKEDLLPFIQAATQQIECSNGMLEHIARCAVRVDLFVVSSRHDIRIDMCDQKTKKNCGFVLDSTDPTMEDCTPNFFAPSDGPSVSSVDLINSPRIRVFGRLDTTSEDSTRVVNRDHLLWCEPLKVTCNAFPVVRFCLREWYRDRDEKMKAWEAGKTIASESELDGRKPNTAEQHRVKATSEYDNQESEQETNFDIESCVNIHSIEDEAEDAVVILAVESAGGDATLAVRRQTNGK
jgi:hypothetical protein